MSETIIRNTSLRTLENLRLRLLDLTARNRLINFRHTMTSSLRIIDVLPNEVFKRLMSESEIRFAPVPEPSRDELLVAEYIEFNEMEDQDISLSQKPLAEEWAKQIGLPSSYTIQLPRTSKKHSDAGESTLNTLLYADALEKCLTSLWRSAESAQLEMGTNILYLTFGFLQWYDIDNTKRLAPLFQIPARLHKGRLNQRNKSYDYTLSHTGEDIISNLSLREKLRKDFAIALPEIHESTTPEDYLQEVQIMIDKNQPTWEVCRFVSLTLLNFRNLLLYRDLDPNRWPDKKNLLNHPVVSRILKGQSESLKRGGELVFDEEYSADDIDNLSKDYPLIENADNSQHCALMDTLNGKNLVIEGPPGTGKSQTIANIICAAMGQGKSVLFVAEKRAALDVVHKKLSRAGFAEFCLTLHSHKSQRSRLVQEVEERLKTHGSYLKPMDFEHEIARFEELKRALKEHAKRINYPWKRTSKTAHQIFTAAVRFRQSIDVNPKILHPDGFNGDNYDPAMQCSTKDLIDDYSNVYRQLINQQNDIIDFKSHPWFGVSNSDLQGVDQEDVEETLAAWQNSLRYVIEEKTAIADLLECETNDLAGTLDEVLHVLGDLERLPHLQGNELLDILPKLRGETLSNTQAYFDEFLAIKNGFNLLVEKIGTDILHELSAVDDIRCRGEQLAGLLNARVKVEAVADAVAILNRIQTHATELYAPIHGIKQALGEQAATHLCMSESGFQELKTAIDVIGSLKLGYWKYRDEIFDNEELDELISSLHYDLAQLRLLKNSLNSSFFLDDLPAVGELHALKRVLDAGGTFSVFSRSWRVARNRALGLAASSTIGLAKLQLLMDDLIAYVQLYTTITTNARYKEAFGTHWKGAETDVGRIAALRNWYKQVRREYGVGFSSRVALGDAVINLSIDSARSIRLLSEYGMQHRLNNLLQEIQVIKDIYSPVSELSDPATLLTGTDGIIDSLQRASNHVLHDFQFLGKDNDLSVAAVIDHINALHLLKERVKKWESIKIDEQLFGGRLRLSVGLNESNAGDWSVLANTLIIATVLDKEIISPELVQGIYAQPSPHIFDLLTVHASRLESAIKTLNTNYNAFSRLVKLNFENWTHKSGKSLFKTMTRNNLALANLDTLQHWLDYIRVRKRLETMGIGKLIQIVEQRNLRIDTVYVAFQAAIYDLLSREILSEDPVLARFSGITHESLQEKFRECDNRIKELTREQIAWQIDQIDIPQGNSHGRVGSYTELSLLAHECSLQRHRTPIRQLVSRASSALMTLKPCFMMGPVSVAHYLPPGEFHFDLVIMDEASQLKPQDALGVIARGDQLVVVGDPKQLPPTSYFDRVVGEIDDDPTGIEAVESILDAMRSVVPSRRLRWHYRSQHESLVAFSNHSFYANNLVIFPSPNKDAHNYGIRYCAVTLGCFVKRRNVHEARMICEAVRDHFIYCPQETLGVIAMNIQQRVEIELRIETLAKQDCVFQELLNKDANQLENLFVKNLENVQGDERDVIFVSMTYGPQQPGGKVAQRFGPINSVLGWRRLNVLLTRAKKRMHIFSSMKSSDIVTQANPSRGVIALRDFLQYCETQKLRRSGTMTGQIPDSDFVLAVVNALKNEGFTAESNVGVAGVIIDVAVVDPSDPGYYLMGIECDGAVYASARSTHDRELLRPKVLERMGWNMHRVWAVDWFNNTKAELQLIIAKLNKLTNHRRDHQLPSSGPVPSKLHAVKSKPLVEYLPGKKTKLLESLPSHYTIAGNDPETGGFLESSEHNLLAAMASMDEVSS